jgi:hypothetical protein
MEIKGILGQFVVPIIVAALTSYAAFEMQSYKLRTEYERNINMIRTNAKAEEAARKLLEFEKFPMRKFETIEFYLKGYEKNELRKILIAAGALRIPSKDEKDKTEYWGLIERNPDRFSGN